MSYERTTITEENFQTNRKKSWKKSRPRVVNVQLTQSEYDLIANASAISGKSKRETIRLLVTKNFNGFEFWANNQKSYITMINELRKYGTNLNQMAKLFDSGEKTILSPADKAIIDELNDNLLKISEYLMHILAMGG